MRHLKLAQFLLACAACLLLPLYAHAATVAAETGVFTISPCPSGCGGAGAISEFDVDGGEGFTSAYSSAPTGINGSGQARAQIGSGFVPLPELGAEAFSLPNAQVSADAGAMQKYVYNGPTSNFKLDLMVEGSVVNSGGPSDAALSGSAAVVLASNLDFSADAATFLGENVALNPGATLIGEAHIDFSNPVNLFNLGQRSVTKTIAFTLNNGDEVFVWAGLLVRGTRGASSDAFNSLGFAFTDGNTDGLSAVPLPAPLLLTGGSLALLALKRRRRTS